MVLVFFRDGVGGIPCRAKYHFIPHFYLGMLVNDPPAFDPMQTDPTTGAGRRGCS